MNVWTCPVRGSGLKVSVGCASRSVDSTGYPVEEMTTTRAKRVTCLLLTASCCLIHPTATQGAALLSWGGGQATPPGLTNIVAVSTAADHTLALTEQGTVVSWGYNFDLQAEVPLWLGTALDIAAGEFFSAAITSQGNVVAWGDNQFAQCDVPPLVGRATAVSAGRAHCLARMANGSVAAWGNNDYGQCDVPPGLANVVAVVARWNHSLALAADGTVMAWGENGSGQTSVPEGLTDVVALAGNMTYSLALRRDGSVFGWGRFPQFPPGLAGVVAIAAGEDHCLALLADGTVVAWGGNVSQQISVPGGLTNVRGIAAAWNYSVALFEKPGQELVLKNPTYTRNAFSISLTSRAGVSYTLQYQTGVAGSSWVSLPPVAGTGNDMTLTDTQPDTKQRFYRVRAE